MTIEEMEARIQTLEKKVLTLEDIEEIKKLQRAYGFYLEHWMAEDVIDLFAEGEDTTLLVAAGQYKGKDAIRRFFHHGQEGIESRRSDNGEFLHQVMQLSGVVHVAPDGKTAKGRWYGFGANAFPQPGGKVNPGWMDGVYEVDYVKQEGVWKLKKVHWCMTFHAPWATSFIDPSKRVDEKMDRPYQRAAALRPTGAPEETLYPSGFICPFHFNNPVSKRKAL
jgi:hypothetical protein